MKKFTLKWRAGAKKKTPTLTGSGNDLGANKKSTKYGYDVGANKKPTVAAKPVKKVKVFGGLSVKNKDKKDRTEEQKAAIRKNRVRGGSWR